MQEMNMNEIDMVSGAVDTATAVSYGAGLATSVAIGASLGPVGIAVAAGGFSLSYFATRYVMS